MIRFTLFPSPTLPPCFLKVIIKNSAIYNVSTVTSVYPAPPQNIFTLNITINFIILICISTMYLVIVKAFCRITALKIIISFLHIQTRIYCRTICIRVKKAIPIATNRPPPRYVVPESSKCIIRCCSRRTSYTAPLSCLCLIFTDITR